MSNDPDAKAPPAQRSVFLSYSRADQARAAQLADALSQAGLTVWWDSLIEGGASFAKSIEAALLASDAVVVLWSATSVASDWVLDEAAHGRDLHKLVPLSIDGTLPPLGFRQYQAIALPASSTGRADPTAVAAVVRAVQAIASGAPAPSRAGTGTGTPAAPAQTSRRRLLIGTAAGAVLVAGGGVLGWRRGWFTAAAPASGSRPVACCRGWRRWASRRNQPPPCCRAIWHRAPAAPGWSAGAPVRGADDDARRASMPCAAFNPARRACV